MEQIKITTPCSFSELYKREVSKPTAAQLFLRNVASVTRRTESTVKNWVYGTAVPDALALQALSQFFGINAATLFPDKRKEGARK